MLIVQVYITHTWQWSEQDVFEVQRQGKAKHSATFLGLAIKQGWLGVTEWESGHTPLRHQSSEKSIKTPRPET
jgi:hypothetical protein